MNTQHLEANGVGIQASQDPGVPSFVGLLTELARDNYILQHTVNLTEFQNDVNAAEAAKKFIISRFEPVYLQALADPLTKFKGVTLRILLAFLVAKYPAEPEEIALQEEELRKKWDSNYHIENLFLEVKEGCDTLVAMKAIQLAEMDKTFNKFAYIAIRGSGQFDSACIKWKALDAVDPNIQLTMVFDAQQDSLHQAGVANSVQLQDLLQATSDQLVLVTTEQQEQRAHNATVLQMIKTKNSSSDADETASTMSAMTAHTAVQERQQRRIAQLEAQVQASITGGGRGGGGGRSGGRGGGRGGGRSGNRDGGRGTYVYRAKSDGPVNSIKTGQFYGNDNYCWSHGYDVAKNHDSKSCESKWRHTGHKEEATGDNPLGGSIKDKEHSKWK